MLRQLPGYPLEHCTVSNAQKTESGVDLLDRSRGARAMMVVAIEVPTFHHLE